MAPGLSQSRDKIAGSVARLKQMGPRRLVRLVEGSLTEEIQDRRNVEASLEKVVPGVSAMHGSYDFTSESREGLR